MKNNKITHPSVILIIYCVFASLSIVVNVNSKPIDGKSKASAFYYLSNYGYIQGSKSEDTAQLLTENVLTNAIRDFQVSEP